MAAVVKVMVVGMFHMSNPGHDLHNVHVDDVLAPRRQAEIAAIVSSLERFGPTQVGVEWPKDVADERYPRYLAGTLPPSRNEVVQLGFGLAKAAGLKEVHGIDVDGDFPYQRVDAYARAHGQAALLESAGREIEALTRKQEQLLADQGISAVLRFLNDSARLKDDNGFYRMTLRIGSGADQPGADLLTAWYRRNFLICANLVQLSKPGDRIVVLYGSGHSFLLRQCVSEMPGFELVEANDFLPASR